MNWRDNQQKGHEMRTTQVKIADIKLDADIYPRLKPDNETVALYRTAIDKLPPVLISKDKWLIDGQHRYLAFIAEGLQEIPAEVIDIPKTQILVEAVRLNSTHGKQLTRSEKKNIAQKLFPMSVVESAKLLGVSQRTISEWTADQRRTEEEARNERIWEAWLACKSTTEIAEMEDLTHPTILDVVEKCKSAKTYNTPPDGFRLYDLWEFNSCAEEYGNSNYPGRIPGQVIENLLWYFTEPRDVVIDPMAGGGTTIDVCKTMGRRYLAYDLRPSRPDIQKHDARKPFPLPDSITKTPTAKAANISLVFLDPPYWKQKRGEYVDGSIDGFDLDKFYIAVEKIIENACAVLSKDGRVALIIGPTQEKKKIFDHAADLIKRIDLNLVRRFIIPYNTQQHGGAFVNAAKENRYPLYLYRDLLVWQK